MQKQRVQLKLHPLLLLAILIVMFATAVIFHTLGQWIGNQANMGEVRIWAAVLAGLAAIWTLRRTDEI